MDQQTTQEPENDIKIFPLHNEPSIGFGYFSNTDDEEAWRKLSYDGLENTPTFLNLANNKKILEQIGKLRDLLALYSNLQQQCEEVNGVLKGKK